MWQERDQKDKRSCPYEYDKALIPGTQSSGAFYPLPGSGRSCRLRSLTSYKIPPNSFLTASKVYLRVGKYRPTFGR